MKSEEVSMSLKVLHSHGWSIAGLAREFGLNWRTVKRELESPGSRTYGPRPRPAGLTEAQLTITVPVEKKPGPHRIHISIQAEPKGIPAEAQTEPVRGPGEGGMPEQGMRSGESDSPGVAE